LVKRIVLIIFWGVLAWYIYANRAEMWESLKALARAEFGWIALAALLQISQHTTHVLGWKYSFAGLNMHWRGREIFPVSLSLMTVNVVAPSMNISGLAYATVQAGRSGLSSTGAFIANVLSVCTDGFAFATLATGFL